MYGKVLASEFKTKGANVILGPGLNVHRVPTGARNFEYISGEDPVLGGELVGPLIAGVKSVPGVMSCMKHFILNNQETQRYALATRKT